ncbi:MAG: sigma-70 family RNA polymerase sigma factor [Syntrophomonadaceae bacterium]
MTNVIDLVVKAQRGDIASFEQLVLLYQDRVYSHCHYLAGNPDDAQDLAQEVFVQAFRGIRSFRRDADFGTWLHRITVNLWINFCRRHRKLATISIDEPLPTREGAMKRELADEAESPQEQVERHEFNQMVAQALDRIPADFKLALVLRDVEGYNYEEIAAMLECSLGTVKSRISRGRQALKKELEKKR